MCDKWCLEMAEDLLKYLRPDFQVLEVGSRDINGSCREIIEKQVAFYWGIDIENGKGVDEIVDACKLTEHFGINKFDCVISTEMLEHVKDWQKAIVEMYAVLKTGGYLLLTTRSPNFPKHNYPNDYWRFTASHMEEIFGDVSEIFQIEQDLTLGWACGIGVIVKKQADFDSVKLNKVEAVKVN